MRKSNKRTEYIIIKVSTKSEIDNCTFAIQHVTPYSFAKMKKRLHALKDFEGGASFYTNTYWDAPVNYYSSIPADKDIVNQIFSSYITWAYVELSPEELESFELPESNLDTHIISINANGDGFTCVTVNTPMKNILQKPFH
ncbi:hypothetical protein ACXZ1K_08790 [Pedobacter sp. PWIIR3]